MTTVNDVKKRIADVLIDRIPSLNKAYPNDTEDTPPNSDFAPGDLPLIVVWAGRAQYLNNENALKFHTEARTYYIELFVEATSMSGNRATGEHLLSMDDYFDLIPQALRSTPRLELDGVGLKYIDRVEVQGDIGAEEGGWKSKSYSGTIFSLLVIRSKHLSG